MTDEEMAEEWVKANCDYKEWHFVDSIARDVNAWCEIPKYMEE